MIGLSHENNRVLLLEAKQVAWQPESFPGTESYAPSRVWRSVLRSQETGSLRYSSTSFKER